MRLPTIPIFLSLLTLALLCTSCSVVPGERVGVPMVSTPLFESISIEGLVTRERRVAGRSSTRTAGFGTASVTNPYAHQVSTTHINTTDYHSTTHYEYYDSDQLRQQVQRLIEDRRIARRVSSDSGVRIVGRVSRGADTGAGRITWNVLNCFGPCLVGLPFLGSVTAEVELRVYRDDVCLGTYRGSGSATWYHPMFGIVPRVPVMRGRSLTVATFIAAENALAQLIAGQVSAARASAEPEAVAVHRP